MPGTKGKKKDLSPTPQVKTLTTLEETKRSLPIYPFKKDLVAAIRDHQV